MSTPTMEIKASWLPDVQKPKLTVVGSGSTSGPAAEWPVLADEALYGLAGDVVRGVDPYTEADQAAVLFVFLAFAGCYAGTDRYLRGGNTEHPGRIWPILTGATSSGAKGTALSVVGQVIRAVDPGFAVTNRASGLSSSEGLIRRVRDANGPDPDAKDFDEGVTDKRLLVVEPEFANVMTRARREGNSLSGTIRDAYDGVPLQTLVSLNPLISTGHHITIVAAITPQELVSKLTSVDLANGFANRFAVVCSRRSKLLPDGGDPPRGLLHALGQRLRDALKATANVRQMRRTPAASDLWAAEYEQRFSREIEDGPVATMFARWHAHSTRMSVVYATLDGSAVVDEQHVRASMAAWDYVEASVRHVFGDEASDPDLGRVAEFVDTAEMGAARDQINKEVFNRHRTRLELDAILSRLVATGRYVCVKLPTEGRAKQVYRRKAGS